MSRRHVLGHAYGSVVWCSDRKKIIVHFGSASTEVNVFRGMTSHETTPNFLRNVPPPENSSNTCPEVQNGNEILSFMNTSGPPLFTAENIPPTCPPTPPFFFKDIFPTFFKHFPPVFNCIFYFNFEKLFILIYINLYKKNSQCLFICLF